MLLSLIFSLPVLSSTAAHPVVLPNGDNFMALNLRAQVQAAPGEWKQVVHKRKVPASQTAIVICDMWDKHWCNGANTRGAAIAKRMEPVLQEARRKGVLIIHAPSECMDAYKETPQRKLA